MDQAEKTMLENLLKNTGKSLEEWVAIAKMEGLGKHGQIVKYLKTRHKFTHGFANLVAHKTLATDAGSELDAAVLIADQYKGKESFLPFYQRLKTEIEKIGNDIEFAPKRSYVSIRRNKQFAMLTPATKLRFEIGLNLKGQKAVGILQEVTAKNAMCSHKICIENPKSPITTEILALIKQAYDMA